MFTGAVVVALIMSDMTWWVLECSRCSNVLRYTSTRAGKGNGNVQDFSIWQSFRSAEACFIFRTRFDAFFGRL